MNRSMFVIATLAVSTAFFACTEDDSEDPNSGGQSGSAGAGSGGVHSGGSSGAQTSGTGGASAGAAGLGGEGGQAGGGGNCRCVEQTVSWENEGGIVQKDTSTVSACSTFEHTRTPLRTDPVDLSCEQELDCDLFLGSGSVNNALNHADVVAAIAAAPVTYGHDSRPVDGTVLRITIGEKVIEVGHPCAGRNNCTEIPAGVQALADVLTQLTDQELGRGTCATVFPEQ